MYALVDGVSDPGLTHRDVLRFATLDGAAACGLDHKIGSITPGKEADLVLIRADNVNTMPINDPAAVVVTSADTSNVDSVFVRGRAVKRDGHLVDVDLHRLHTCPQPPAITCSEPTHNDERAQLRKAGRMKARARFCEHGSAALRSCYALVRAVQRFFVQVLQRAAVGRRRMRLLPWRWSALVEYITIEQYPRRADARYVRA